MKRDAASEAQGFFTSTLRLAACLIGPCGYPLERLDHVQSHSRGETVTKFWIGQISEKLPTTLSDLLRSFNSGKLEQTSPIHPLLSAMRAQLAYEALLNMQSVGAPKRLVRSVHGSSFTYADGPVELVDSPVQITDLSLAAALSVVGVPVLRILGALGARTYHLPVDGHPIMIGSSWGRYNTMRLIERRPTDKDPRRLALEDVDPTHPLCAAYDSLHARTILKRAVSSARPVLHIQHQVKQALIDPQASDRVMSRLERFIGSPPTR